MKRIQRFLLAEGIAIEIDESCYSPGLEDQKAIQAIKESVLWYENDMLLVYMFDRICRNDFEVLLHSYVFLLTMV